jgi:NADH dehydrogenase [ubiquinone] 1 alpha subcomplex assembly factor 6
MTVDASRELTSLVRDQDRERFLTTLFAPAEHRSTILALVAFNYEIARTAEVVSEPVLGRIRLQWWREALDAAYGSGPVRAHEVVRPLTHAIRRYGLSRVHFEQMLLARERDLMDEPPATIADLETYAADTAGRLRLLVLEALRVSEQQAKDAAREVGIAYALSGLLRAIPFHARAKRRYLPDSLMQEIGVSERDLYELRATPTLAKAVHHLAEQAAAHLVAARAQRGAISRAALPALLEGVLASRHLRRLARVDYNVFDRSLARPQATPVLPLWLAMQRGRF